MLCLTSSFLNLKTYITVEGKIPVSTAEEFKVEEKDTKNLSTVLEELGRMILDIGDKEASGMPLLAFYLSRLSAFINAKRAVNLRVEVMFTVNNISGQRGVNPNTDAALVLVLDSKKRKPAVLYEYKPRIAGEVKGLSIKDLMELFIQGYYCMIKHSLQSCVLCLTDSIMWHYFGVNVNEEPQIGIKIIWTCSLGNSDTSKQEDTISRHFEFICSLALFDEQ